MVDEVFYDGHTLPGAGPAELPFHVRLPIHDSRGFTIGYLDVPLDDVRRILQARCERRVPLSGGDHCRLLLNHPGSCMP